tara:strand:- start:166 stop:807 length:642 start_codon:yes stop_codon:yes gene_type:complete
MDQNAEWYSRFAGRTFTFGAWVKSAEATIIKLFWYDNSGSYTYTSANAGTGWEWLEITGTTADAAVQFFVGFNIVDTKTVYISQPMLVFGSSIGEGNYTRPQGEVVQCDKEIQFLSNVTISSNADYNLESLSSGKIPKGTKAIYMRGQATPNAAGDHIGIMGDSDWQSIELAPTTYRVHWDALINVESTGVIDIQRSATFTAVYMNVNAIVLQ